MASVKKKGSREGSEKRDGKDDRSLLLNQPEHDGDEDDDVENVENEDDEDDEDEPAADEQDDEAEEEVARKPKPVAAKNKSAQAAREERNREAARRHKPIEEEPIPVFGGRLLVAGAMLLAMAVIPMSDLGRLIEPRDETIPNPTAWSVGQTATVAVTVITADYNKLACASEQEIEGSHCQFKTEKELWPKAPDAPLDDNKKNVIQPYRTWLDNRLVMISGLWAEPHVAMRLHSEPTVGVAEEKLARFVATCKVKFIGELKPVRLRWAPGGPWGDPDMMAIVAKPESCSVSSPSD